MRALGIGRAGGDRRNLADAGFRCAGGVSRMRSIGGAGAVSRVRTIGLVGGVSGLQSIGRAGGVSEVRSSGHAGGVCRMRDIGHAGGVCRMRVSGDTGARSWGVVPATSAIAINIWAGMSHHQAFNVC